MTDSQISKHNDTDLLSKHNKSELIFKLIDTYMLSNTDPNLLTTINNIILNNKNKIDHIINDNQQNILVYIITKYINNYFNDVFNIINIFTYNNIILTKSDVNKHNANWYLIYVIRETTDESKLTKLYDAFAKLTPLFHTEMVTQGLGYIVSINKLQEFKIIVGSIFYDLSIESKQIQLYKILISKNFPVVEYIKENILPFISDKNLVNTYTEHFKVLEPNGEQSQTNDTGSLSKCNDINIDYTKLNIDHLFKNIDQNVFELFKLIANQPDSFNFTFSDNTLLTNILYYYYVHKKNNNEKESLYFIELFDICVKNIVDTNYFINNSNYFIRVAAYSIYHKLYNDNNYIYFMQKFSELGVNINLKIEGYHIFKRLIMRAKEAYKPNFNDNFDEYFNIIKSVIDYGANITDEKDIDLLEGFNKQNKSRIIEYYNQKLTANKTTVNFNNKVVVKLADGTFTTLNIDTIFY